MRIALISEHASPLAGLGGVDAGGQNIYVHEVANGLSAAGHSVDVFTRRETIDQADIVEVGAGYRVVHVPAGPARSIPKEDLLAHMPAFATWLRSWLTENTYDIVHANFFMSGSVASSLRRWTGIPFVVTFHALGAVRKIHQGDSDRFPADRIDLEQKVIDDAAAVVAECPQDESDLLRFYRIDRSRIVTIPCGVDTDVFRPTGKSLARARHGWGDDEWVVLHVGRMVPRKGVDTVIEAVAELHRRGHRDVSLVVVGGSSEQPTEDDHIRALIDLAKRAGIGDRVRFTGRVDHERLPHFYGAADVFVTTPWYEPFGITPLEAMACGLPVVGSNVGGIKYTVRDGETGFLVSPHDANAVADRLEELHRLPWLASALAENARKRTEDLFTWERVTDSLIRLYENVLSGQHPDQASAATPVFQRSIDELSGLLDRSTDLDSQLRAASQEMIRCLSRGGKVLVAGNGGSASQAQHLAAELMGRFMIDDRPAHAVVSLTTDTAVLTAWANDRGFEDVFSRQVEGLGRRGDVVIGLSTSGNSPNLVRAFETARRNGLSTIAFLGGDGGELAALTDVPLVVASRNTQRIQEVHLLLLHILSGLVEAALATGTTAASAITTADSRRLGSGVGR